MCFFMETRLDKKKKGFDKLYGDLLYQNHIIVKQPDIGGGLAMLWKTDVNVEVVNFTANHILVKVKEDDGFMWFLSGFYGWPDQVPHASDHLLVLLQTKCYAKHGANRGGGFKFEEAWLMWEECGAVIENAWQ